MLQFSHPAGLNETEVKVFIGTVNLVAYDRVTDRAQVHTNLMSPSRARMCANQGELFSIGRIPLWRARRSRHTLRSNESTLDVKFSLRWCAAWVDHLL